jgi:hypothetical protein
MNEVTILAPNEVVEQLEASERLPNNGAILWTSRCIPRIHRFSTLAARRVQFKESIAKNYAPVAIVFPAIRHERLV